MKFKYGDAQSTGHISPELWQSSLSAYLNII
jgi:hypothetical protein